MRLARHGYAVALFSAVVAGCTHGAESRCAEMDGGWETDCLTANAGCEARGTCPGPVELDPETQCRDLSARFLSLFLDPEVGYALPEEMDVGGAAFGLLLLVDEDASHRIELPGVDFRDWFSFGETVSLEYRVDAPYRGLEIVGETSRLLQLAQSRAPLPNGVQLLPGDGGCAFPRDWDPDAIVTVSGLRIVDASAEVQLTSPTEARLIDGWLVAGMTQTRGASTDGTRPQNDAWAAVALGPRGLEP